MSFQVNTLDLKQPASFLKLGDTIPSTKLKLTGFKFRVLRGPNFEDADASELSLINTETNEQTILILWKVTDIPTVRYVTPAPAK